MTTTAKMSPNREDYLKIIFELGGDTKKVSNKQILGGLNVSAASVSEMISKLVDEHYVIHTPYQGVQLTKKGIKAAALLIRKHRLWEVFLVKELHYAFNTVHPEAEVLEHVTTAELAQRLDAFLGFPKRCPHGGVIPDADGNFAQQSHVSLASLSAGIRAKIDRIIDDHELLDYIRETGLAIDDHVIIRKISPFAGAITLYDQRLQTELQIGLKAAEHIFVDKESN